MARLRAMTFCLSHTHDRKHTHKWQPDVEITQFDEKRLRELLQKGLKRFSRRAFCREPGGWLIADQDILELRVRSGVVLIDTAKDDLFIPNALTCANCGWRTEPSHAYDHKGKRAFCQNPACRQAADEAMNRSLTRKLTQHQKQGFCVYGDEQPTPEYEFCPNKATHDDHLCGDHHGRCCEVCGNQAYWTYWEFGSFAYAHYRCREH